MSANLENSSMDTGLEKYQFSLQSERKAMPKTVQTNAQLSSSHMLAKWCSKFSKSGFNNMQAMNFQTFKLDLEKQRNERSDCQHLLDHWKIKKDPGKHLFLLYSLCQSPWMCGSQQTVDNSSRGGNTRPPDLLPEKSIWRSRSNS